MNSFARAVIELLIADIEGDVGDIEGDKGGLTVFGLSTRYHGAYVRRATLLIQNGQRDVAREEAVQIYYREYYTHIYGWRTLEAEYPWLMTLLFNGRVHGIGQRDYVREVQTFINTLRSTKLVIDGQLGPRTLSSLRSLTGAERNRLFDYLTSEQVVERLTKQRQRAVQIGGAKNVDRGIRNRILKEMKIASVHYERGAGDTEIALASSSEKMMAPWTPVKTAKVPGLEVRPREPEEGALGTKLISV